MRAAVDPGFEAEGLLTFRISPAFVKYGSPEALTQFYDDLISRLEEIPGIASAGGVTVLPLHGIGAMLATRIDEFPPAEDDFPPVFLVRRATPGYFETMSIPLVEGRTFTADDHNDRLGTLIMSATVKDRYWPDESALGKRIRTMGAAARSVGVVGNVHANGLDTPTDVYMYKPMLDSVRGGVGAMSMVVRSDAEPLSLVPAIRSMIGAIDPDLAISDVRSMEEVVAD